MLAARCHRRFERGRRRVLEAVDQFGVDDAAVDARAVFTVHGQQHAGADGWLELEAAHDFNS